MTEDGQMEQLRLRAGQERIAVVVNDFGESQFDSDRLKEAGSADIVEIPGGCICCTAPEGFVGAVASVIQEQSPDRIFIEPTGLALPADLVDTLRRAPYAQQLAIQPVVVLIDPANLPGAGETLEPLLAQQVEAGDVIVGNRGGLQATISLAKGKLSFAFINHGDRAFKDIEHRKIGHMTVYNGGAESGFPLTLPRTLRTAA